MSEVDSKYDKLLELADTLEVESGSYLEIGMAKNRVLAALGGIGLVTPAQIPAPVQQVGADGLISGGQVSWIGLLSFVVSASSYRIGGVVYNSPQATITLNAADATNPRIDMLVVNTSSVAAKVTGTPAASPSAPSVDPATQLALTFILVAQTATVPSNITKTDIYLENTEWTAAQTGSAFTFASTVNPFAGTKDVEATNAAAGNILKLTKPAAGTETLSNYNSLSFFIRFKAAWPSSKSLSVAWLNGSTQIGQAVTVKPGLFNLDGANITGYQQVIIPVSSFNALTAVTSLQITVVGSGGSIGFYLDNISLQSGITSNALPTGLLIFRGAYSASIAYSTNDVVTSAGATYVALANSTGVTPGTDATKWAVLAAAATSYSTINALTDQYLWEDFLIGGVDNSHPQLAWSATNVGFGTPGQTPDINHPGIACVNVGSATSGNYRISPTSQFREAFNPAGIFEYIFVIFPTTNNTITGVKYRFGFYEDTNDPPTSGIYFEKLAADSNWFAVCRTGGAQTRVDTGIAFTADTWYKIVCRRINGSTIGFKVNAGSEVTIATNVPTTFQNNLGGFLVTPADALNHYTYWDFFSYRRSGLTR